MKIDFFLTKDKTPHQVKSAQALCKAFERLGAQTECIDFSGGHVREYLQARITEKADFSCSFDLMGLACNESFLWDSLELKHLQYSLDAPLKSAVALKSYRAILTIADNADYEQLRTMNETAIHFLPNAADAHDLQMGSNERALDLTFFGNYLHTADDKQRWKFYFTKEVCELLELAAHIAITDPKASLIYAIQKANTTLNINFQGVKLNFLYHYLARYCKAQDRCNLLHCLKEFNVHIFGGQDGKIGWKKNISHLPNAILHFPLSYKEAQGIAGQSKFIVNSSPQCRQGLHPRIVEGIVAGAMIITNESLFLQKEFPGESALLYYTPGKEKELQEEIASLLANEEKRKERVLNGQRVLLQKHTWDIRADTILKYIKL